MTAVPLFVHESKVQGRLFRVACPECPDMAHALRTHGPTLDACVAHDARHAGRDSAGVA